MFFAKLAIIVTFLASALPALAAPQGICTEMLTAPLRPVINQTTIEERETFEQNLIYAGITAELSQRGEGQTQLADLKNHLQNAEKRLKTYEAQVNSRLTSQLSNYDQLYSRITRIIPFSSARKSWTTDIKPIFKELSHIEHALEFIKDMIETIGDTSVLSESEQLLEDAQNIYCLLYTSPSPRDRTRSRMPSSA